MFTNLGRTQACEKTVPSVGLILSRQRCARGTVSAHKGPEGKRGDRPGFPSGHAGAKPQRTAGVARGEGAVQCQRQAGLPALGRPGTAGAEAGRKDGDKAAEVSRATWRAVCAVMNSSWKL